MCSHLYTAITFLVLDSVLSFDFGSKDYEINYFPYVIIIYYQETLISKVLIIYENYIWGYAYHIDKHMVPS